jgi:hypothetical protein
MLFERGNNSCIYTMREQLKMKSEFWMIISMGEYMWFKKWLRRIFIVMIQSTPREIIH